MKTQQLLKSPGYQMKCKGQQQQQLRERAIYRLLEKNSEITSMMCVAQSGLDVSVARRTLKDMEDRGILICRAGGEQRRSFYYSLAGIKPLKVKWTNIDNGCPLGQHHRNTL